jgi:hypothetical protein
MQKAKDLFENAEFEDVIRVLQSAMVNGDLSQTDEQQAHVWLAISYVALDNVNAARRAFRYVLGNQPEFRLPHHSAPRVVALLENVRDDRPSIAVTEAALRKVAFGVSADFKIAFANQEDTAALLHWRCSPVAPFLTEPIGKTSPASVGLAVSATCGRLEYYAELVSGQESFAHDGLPGSPKMAMLPSEAPPPTVARPFYKTWWFWTIVSAAAAGGATAAAVVLTRPQDTTAVVEVRGLAR